MLWQIKMWTQRLGESGRALIELRRVVDPRVLGSAMKLHSLSSKVGLRPAVWLCHSLGCLLAKEVLKRDYEKGSRGLQLCNSVRGVLFYGGPHNVNHLYFSVLPYPDLRLLHLYSGFGACGRHTTKLSCIENTICHPEMQYRPCCSKLPLACKSGGSSGCQRFLLSTNNSVY